VSGFLSCSYQRGADLSAECHVGVNRGSGGDVIVEGNLLMVKCFEKALHILS